VVLTSNGTALSAPERWGTFPVDASRTRAFAADVNGNGRADLVLQTELWGMDGDVPAPGDYDGDGKSELVFSIDDYNRGGYRLFYDDFGQRAVFEFSYH